MQRIILAGIMIIVFLIGLLVASMCKIAATMDQLDEKMYEEYLNGKHNSEE